MNNISPEKFDLLGVVFFPFIFLCALYMLVTGNVLPDPILWAILLSGLIGFVIDGGIVYRFFLSDKKK